MTAMQAGIRIYGQFGIMICRNIVACQGKVIIFIHKTDIDAGRAGLAMVAIHTGTCHGLIDDHRSSWETGLLYTENTKYKIIFSRLCGCGRTNLVQNDAKKVQMHTKRKNYVRILS